VNPHLAKQTKFSEADLGLLWQSLVNLFEHDRSASRGEMVSQKLFVFEHDSSLGNAPAHRLFERITVDPKDKTRPARAFSDYRVAVQGIKDLPEGITLHEKL
jgi:CRISPR-associated protein Csd2